jgi:hypothetical protein
MQRIATVTDQFNERTGRLPNDLTNLIVQTGANAYEPVNVSNDDPVDGKEVLSSALDSVLPLRLHILSAAEAQELRRLGISNVRNLNPSDTVDAAFNGTPAANPHLERVEVAEGVAVMMVGAGFDMTAWDNALTIDRPLLNPELVYRIVLGVGKDSELVTTGQLQGSAISPQGSQTDNYLFNNYLVVLPRLSATVNDVGRPLPVANIEARSRAGEVRTVDVTLEQQGFQFNVVSPEGKNFPPAEAWTITTLQ